MTALIILVPFLIFVILNIVLGLITSKKSTHSTEVGLDKFKFVVKGSDLFKILANLTNAELNEEGIVVATTATKWYEFWKNRGPYINPINWILRIFFGVWWVSWMYPKRQVFKFKISDIHRYHQVSGSEELRKAVTVQLEKETEELYRFIERPYYKELTLGKDGSRVEVVAMIEGEIIDPVKAAMSLRGQFFKRLDPAVNGRVEDWANNMDYPTMLTTHTGKHGSVWRYFEKATKSSGGCLNDLLTESCGIKLTDCYLEEFRPIGELAKVTEEKAVATIRAKVVAINTEAEASREERLAEANARTFGDPILAMVALGVSKDVAAQVVGRQVVFDKLAQPDSKITTYVEGGESKTGIVLPTK